MANNNYTTYNLIDYSSVYTDEFGNWVVDDSYVREEGISISSEATDKAILKYLKDVIGWLSTDDMRKICLDEYGDAIEICARKGMMPLGALVPVYA